MSRWYRYRWSRLCLSVVVMVPVVVSALYMWMAWDPTKTVNHMPVALVNSDHPASRGSTPIDAGSQVTRNLLDSHALDFRQVDHDEAVAGLAAGRYYFVVEIPSDFSSTLSEIGTGSLAPALIHVTYNDNNTVMASNIGARAMSAINAAVLKGVASGTVGDVLTGVDTLADGLRSAADGSGKLHQGTAKLATGADDLTRGLSDQLTPGVTRATAGSDQLAAGAASLNQGMHQFVTGTDRLGSGARTLADGIDQLVAKLDVASLHDALEQLRTQLPANAGNDLAQVVAVLNGLRQLQSGSRQIADQLTDPHADYRGGLDKLVTGTGQLDTGAATLADGMHELTAGTGRVTDGARKLQTGAHQVDDGAGQLADGLANGVKKLPDLGDKSHQTTLAELLATPVETASTNIAPAQFNGPGAAPSLLTISSALVALVVFMCFRAHRFVTGGDAGGPLRPTMRRTIAVTLVSLTATAVVAAAIWQSLTPHPSVASMPETIAILGGAVGMYVALTGLLFTVLGYVAGSLATLALLMFQVFSYGGIWMVETLPAPFRLLHPVMPMTYVRRGLIAAFNGAPGFEGALIAIYAVSAVATVLTVLVATSGRSRYLRITSTGKLRENPAAEPVGRLVGTTQE
ncbi:YhgE/Pip family protein [Nocardia nova]|uniref:YhgE/Pip family protein n=1 Tax=Nocardia nova TaxID=37330 RepID=UPI003F5408A0